MAFPVGRTGLLQIGAPLREPRVNLGKGGASWILKFFTSASNFVTAANVYQDAALTTPFTSLGTGVVQADTNGLFPKIYVDTSVNYGVQFCNAASVVQRQYAQYQGSLANTGTAAAAGNTGLNVNGFNEYTLTTVAGGSGNALTINAQAPAGIPLRISGTGGSAALQINTCVTTGAQTATFSATNKPGAGQVTVLLTAAPPAGAGYVGGTLTANWPYATMSATATVTLSTGQVITGCTLTNGSTAFTTPSTTITGSPNTAISVSTGIGPVAWLPIQCDGSIYYTPLWRGDAFSPPIIVLPQVNGQTLVAAALSLNGNGSTTVVGTGASATPASWYTPNTTGVGTNYWLQATVTSNPAGNSLTSPNGAIVGSWINISSTGMQINLTQVSNGTTGAVSATYQISSASGGTPVVASGTITLTPQLSNYTTAGTFTETIPSGPYSTVIIEAWSGGGGGGGSGGGLMTGGSGATGGYSRSVYLLSALGGAGKTFTVVVGAAGPGGGTGGGAGTGGGNSSVAAGTVTGFTNMLLNGGGGATGGTNVSPGTGGAAGGVPTGGTAANTNGNAGVNGSANFNRAPAGVNVNLAPNNTVAGGGGGGFPSLPNGQAGVAGGVAFTYI